METIDLKKMTKVELNTLLQNKIFQLGVNGIQHNDLIKQIEDIENEMKTRVDEDTFQAKQQKDGSMPEESQTKSDMGKENE